MRACAEIDCPELRQALAGRVQPHHLVLIGQILAHIDLLEQGIAQLQVEIERCLPPFEEALELLQTIPGIKAVAAAARDETGIAARMSYVPRAATRALLPVLGLAVPPMRGLVENLYIFYEPYVVDHSAFSAEFGNDATPLHEAIRQTVAWLRSKTDQPATATVAAPAMTRS